MLFLENIEVCAKNHGQIWHGPADVGHPVVSIPERPRLPSGHRAYGSAARPLRPQIKDGVVLESLGSFSSDDRDGGDDAGLKNDFNFTFECRNSVNHFRTPIGLKICSG